MNRSNKTSPGYSTRDALTKLRDDILAVIEEHKQKGSVRYGFIKNIISFSSEKVLLSGVAYTITLIYIFCLILTYLVGESVEAGLHLLWEALFLFIILVLNFLLAWNEDYLFRNEIPHKVKRVLETLDEAIQTTVWRENHYPHLCAPFSPCVILQWTYRDGEVVNLPWALLVEGDIVVMRPGQEAPGHCRGLQPTDPELFFGQTFQPQSQHKAQVSGPRVRTPHENKAYRMCETPYLKNLRIALQHATSRPITVYEKQRYLCTVKLMEGVVLPAVLCVVVVASAIRHAYRMPGVVLPTQVYLLNTIAATIPLLQILFPIAWILLNCYGLARFKILSEKRQKYARPKSCSISEDANDPLITALSESNLKPESLKSLGRTFFNILVGRDDMICRTANIVHVLGSLSALCCVDKKGILSWPNPTAEKVFFLRNSSPLSRSSSKTSLVAAMEPHTDHTDKLNPEPSTIAEVLDLTHDQNAPYCVEFDDQRWRLHLSRLKPLVLDLTHDQNAPFCVEFDDQRWRLHLSRLKPLGLAALLNTCAPAPRHTYAHFCAHLTCEALNSEDLVPVTNRRCLCELAKQIGFSDTAADSYTVEECLAVFRQLQADTIRRETRFARSLHLSTRVKVPLPHMLAVIVKDHANQLQMLTQGTADIIVDSCVDYWNGRDLTPISAADRKKIIDFYQRNSLTAYCTAFAYKPLRCGVSPTLSQMYLELPPEPRHQFAPHSHQWAHEPAMHFHSTDSLLFNELNDEEVKDADGFFDMQCNQVFIGMVTMQYQAQSDMVELIERLERACIRFVHFSKENELRSRVFSEKMGLESGWNCHISLMSENTDSSNMTASKALSSSAPGAINLDHSTVKFESEIKKTRHSITTHGAIKMQRGSLGASGVERRESTGCGAGEGGESPPDACRSLSCLTDSTDHDAPVNFDMSNRAKLPRGIENIRPHIEQVDNVPLLVSLFTDCTPATVQEMIHIMQDYGEVVCVMGSAANCLNMEIFMQADASIAVEPLYPVLCQKMPPYQVPEKCLGPIDLARVLNSLPCSLSMTRDADVSLFALLTMSRHHMLCVWNTTQFWMCAVCFLSFLQVASLCVYLPPLLSVCLSVSAVCVCGAVSCALAFPPLDPAAMQRAHTATLRVHYKMVIFVFWCYACKFIPSLISILLLYGFTLRSFCEQIMVRTNWTSCWIVYPVNVASVENAAIVNAMNATRDLSLSAWQGWGDVFYEDFYLAQHIAFALVTLHLIVISISFIHRQYSIWQKGFWTNRVWCAIVICVIIGQSIVSAVLLSGRGVARAAVTWRLLIGYLVSPILIFTINEIIKWQEIKVDARNQRRARLDFGTKLGMNSPF